MAALCSNFTAKLAFGMNSLSHQMKHTTELAHRLTLRFIMSYIYGAPSKARNANVVYIWTYVWQR